jgi:battenin
MQQCMLDAQHSRASSLELALSRRPSRDEDDGGPSTSGSAAAASGRNAMGGRLLQQPPPQQEREREQCRQRADSEAEAAARQLLPQSHVPSDAWREVQQPPGSCGHAQGADVAAASSSAAATASATLTMRQRLHHTAALWPYMVPLFAVYFAEYAMQAGTWTAIGFPVTSEEARRRFYLAANSCYQAGVFISRSSGLLFQAGRGALWAMPGAQCLLLAAFFWDAATHWWYNWLLMGPCFAVGLLGGAVYVNAFTLISREVAPELREFSLGAACVADSLGIAAADACSILLQGCLFRLNGLSGAAFKCG